MPIKLNGLIRFQKWELDDKRRELSALEDERDQILGQLRGLLQEFEQEKAQAGQGIAILTMGAYAAGVALRREVLEEQLKAKDTEIQAKRDEVTTAYQELKTYEIAEETRQKAEQKEKARTEGLVLDEQGQQGYLRQQKEK